MRRPRIVIAAPASGSGKTMLTCGILQALMERGKRVSSFKCGPDYIDPLFHETVIGAKAGNLDLFFAGEQGVREIFCRDAADTDLSVVEGVMGYYDGMAAASPAASTYEVAGVLDAPVVLVVNARGQSLSALANLYGFLHFQPDSQIRGVIFNQMSAHIFDALREDVRKMGVEPLGYLPRAEEFVIESRHLGLVTPDEIEGLSRKLHGLAELLEKTVNLDALVQLAEEAPALPEFSPVTVPKLPPVKIAVAKDEAFCFLYRDNLTLLREFGAELVFFSPVSDEKLPDGIRGILLPGGYPELYAEKLSRNVAMRREISGKIRGGMPCLAECGGFLYLHRELEDMEGNFFPMAGVLDAKAYRTKKLGRFGYITLTAEEPFPLLHAGEAVRGHEFHYYESESCGEVMTAVKPVTGKSWKCMHAEKNLLAGFPHLFYRSNPALIERFLRQCLREENV